LSKRELEWQQVRMADYLAAKATGRMQAVVVVAALWLLLRLF
jgi:hypothetical protein